MKVDPEQILNSQPTISPYRTLIGTQVPLLSAALERVRWDARPEALRSKYRLCKEQNSFPGGKAVIVCNGPSLLRTDLTLLKDTFTFGLNKINLLFESSTFRPSCIVAINRLVIQQNAAYYNHTTLPLYLGHAAHGLVQFRRNVRFMHMVRCAKFARDVSGSVNEGATVTFAALQIAFHLGFRNVALIGCDHAFATTGAPNATVVSQGSDRSHFHPNYFGSGVQWQLPDLAASESSYKLAGSVFEAHGGQVVNCTEGGVLEVFERQKLEVFLKK